MEYILTNNFDDYTCIKYLDDNCVSTTFKIPSVEDIIRLSVCSGDVLCCVLQIKQIFILNRMLLLINQKEMFLNLCLWQTMMIKISVQ